MPIKELHNGRGPKGSYSFGGGADVVYTDHTEDSPLSYYTIFGNGGDDTIFGSDESDNLFGGDGSDHLWGGLGDDLLDAGSWGSPDSGKGQNSSTNYLFGDGPAVAIGGAEPVDWTISSNFVSGNDTLRGGFDATNLMYGDGEDLRLLASVTFTGGTDVIYAGDGSWNQIWGDGTLAEGAGTSTLKGGGDVIHFSTGSDDVYGDYQILDGYAGSFVAGKDTFVFDRVGGTDNIFDFQPGYDKLDFHLLGLATADLAGTDNLFIDDADEFATQVGFDLLINLGAATGGADSFLLVHGVTSISVDDVYFTDTVFT